jgi:catechol 2,3-dioxygenase-like lactoylglutathione lyase family enzyme
MIYSKPNGEVMKQFIYILLSSALFSNVFAGDVNYSNANMITNEIKASRDIIGNNAFLYYKNYDEATNFYGDILGFKNVFEFPDFATIFQTTKTTFITVVNDNGRGMHSSDEPKTIAIALVTDQVDGWYQYALSQDLNIKNPPKPLADNPHHAFLVTDPGGYILEFEHFADHPENKEFIPLLNNSENIYGVKGSQRPDNLAFKASIYWLYHSNEDEAEAFYQEVMGLKMIVEQSFSDILTSSPTGYIGLVEDGIGIHNATHEKAVNVGFMTNSAQAWFDYLKEQSTFSLRTEELYHEQDGQGNNLIDIVIGYDPDNYFIEIDEFLDSELNRKIRNSLGMN